jgi:hypothetical protein
MKKLNRVILMAAMTLLLAAPGFAVRNEIFQGQGQAVVTMLPEDGGQTPVSLPEQDLKVTVDGKTPSNVKLTPLRGPADRAELVILIDGGARNTLGTQIDDFAHFVQSLPPNVKVAVGYMINGHTALTGPLTTDHAQARKGLHLPGGMPGISASPYFCLSDLAKHWPSQDRQARREVVMVTDGIDYYDFRFDPYDPYVESATDDAVRAGLVVYSIYWSNQGRARFSLFETNTGQSLVLQVTDATGGNSYWEGMGNPVSFQPYLQDIARRLENQYKLTFVARLDGKPEIENLKLKSHAPATKIVAPQEVLVSPSGPARD